MEVAGLAQIPLDNTDLVLLDLDNTLYDYDFCHRAAMEVLSEGFRKHFGLDDGTFKNYYSASRKLINTRHHGTAVSHSRLFYIQDMVEKICGKTDSYLTSNLYRLYWDHFISMMELFPDSLGFLQVCRERHIPVVMVTDMTAEVQFAKIEKLGIRQYFSYIVTSEEAGIEKPDKFIFEYAIEKALRVRADINTIAVVGDDVRKDVYESERYEVGIYHINRDGQCTA